MKLLIVTLLVVLFSVLSVNANSDKKLTFNLNIPVVSSSSSSTPTMGGFLGANNKFFTTFKPIINSLLVSEIKNFSIPNVNQDSHDASFSITDITITSFDCNNCVSLSIVGDYIAVAVSGLAANLHFDYAAEWKKIIKIHAHGHCSPSVSGVSVSAHASFGPPSSAGTPTIVVSDLNVHLSHLSAHCSGITGAIIDGITDVIKAFFMKTMEKILTNVLTKELNKELQKLKLQTTIDGGFAVVDYSIVPSHTFISNGQVQIGVAGVIEPAANPSIVFPFQPPTGFRNFCNGNQVQVGLSTYTFMTAYYSYYYYNRMHSSIPNAIEAGKLSLLLPGFAKNLGKDAKLTLVFDASGPADFSTNQSSQSFNVRAPFNLTLLGGPSGNFFYTMGVDATASVSISLNASASMSTSPRLMLQVNNIALSNAKTLASNVGGGLVATLVVGLLDIIIDTTLLKGINDYFKKTGGIPLPSFGGFAVSGGDINYNGDGICVALNVKQVS